MLVLLLAGSVNSQAAPPPPPSSPFPLDGATGVPARTVLNWSFAELNLIQNGGFEEGETGWSFVTQGFGAGFELNDGSQNPNGPDTPTAPLEGNFSIFSEPGFFGDAVLVLYQDITIPTNTSRAVLSWSDRIRSYGDFLLSQNDVHGFIVQITDTSFNTLQLLFVTEPGDPLLQDWTKRRVDVSDFAGRRVRIAFYTFITNGPLTVHLDRISLLVDPPAGVTTDVRFDTDFVLTSEDLIGVTNGTSWIVEDLQPDTTYFWRLVTRLDGQELGGPTWSFTTASRGPLDRLEWSPLPQSLQAGSTVEVTLTAQDASGFAVTNFNGPAGLSATAVDLGGAPLNLLQDQPHTAFADFQRTSVGYAFTPNADLWVTGLRTLAGHEAALWDDQGQLLARLALDAAPGAWTETPLASPVLLQAGHRYRVSVYTRETQRQFLRFDASPSFAHGTIHQSYETVGNGFPDTPHPAQWFYVDLAYVVPSLTPLELDPETTGDFVAGSWNGLPQLPSDLHPTVALRADDDEGTATGWSSLFELEAGNDRDLDGMPDDWEITFGFNPDDPSDADEDADMDGATNVEEYLAGTDPRSASSRLAFDMIRIEDDDVVLTFQTVVGGEYRVDRAHQLEDASWEQVGAVLSGDDTPREVRDIGGASRGPAFYRLFVVRP